jgi:2-desacetyl-2-hydroxyethyl bacteriochlorophyllide A dehydrogenase
MTNIRALECTRPGELRYRPLEMPQRKADEVIVKIKRIGICGTDLHAFEGTQPYFSYPRILGHELAAEIIDAGDSGELVPGQLVTILPYFSCGKCVACRRNKPNCCVNIQVYGVHIDGGMREYVSLPAKYIVNGRGLDVEQLALVEPLAIGAHGLSRAAIDEGEFVLVIGAGPIGLGTMELAAIAGGKVIATDVNDSRLKFCRENLNVYATIDARNEDVAAALKNITGGEMPTVVIDATGNLQSINQGINYLAHGGKYILIGLQKENFSFSHPEFHKREATLMSSRNATIGDFRRVIDCLESGLIRPETYITHRVTFEGTASALPEFLAPASGVIKAMVCID